MEVGAANVVLDPVQPYQRTLYAPLTVNQTDLKAPWKFMDDFPTGKKLKDAVDEITQQISSLFEVHEEMAKKHEMDSKSFEEFQKAIKVVKSAVRDMMPEEDWLDRLEAMESAVAVVFVERIKHNDEERAKVNEKLNAFDNVSSGIRKACGASSCECAVCLHEAVKIAYDCGHCICKNCDMRKRSHNCHLCGQLVQRKIDLFL